VALDVSAGATATVRGRATCPRSISIHRPRVTCIIWCVELVCTSLHHMLRGKRSAAGLGSYTAFEFCARAASIYRFSPSASRIASITAAGLSLAM